MIYSTFKKRPYLARLLLGLVFVVGVVELALASSDIFPGRYDWILGCLLFVTTLAWMGAAALTGIVAPADNTVMKCTYRVLLIFPFAIVAFVAAGLQPFSQPVGLTLWVWMALAGLVGALTPRNIGARTYVLLVIGPLLVSIGVLAFFPPITSLPRPDWENWHSIETALLLGSYVLAAFLLYGALLSRLAWTERLRSNLLFISVAVSTLALVTLTLGFVVKLGNDLLTVALFGLLILLPFGAALLRAIWSEQCRERRLRDFRVSVTALGIAMSSHWVIMIVAVTGDVFLLGGSSFGAMILMPVMAGIVVSVPLGYLISEMRHPHRNVLVAAIGPGLLMLMIMCFYWFDVLDKSF